MTFEFKCATCDEIHVGMPSFGWDKPLSYFSIPEDQCEQRCRVSTDDCIIDGSSYFVRGCLEIPVHGEAEVFSWGVWISLSEESYKKWLAVYDEPKRSHVGPFFGWLNAPIPSYPDTINLKTMLHLRDDGIRPYIELEATDHPLAVEQRDGITVARVAELYALMMHTDE
jgi:hypothetical protein